MIAKREFLRFGVYTTLLLYCLPLDVQALLASTGVPRLDFWSLLQSGRALRAGLDPYGMNPNLIGPSFEVGANLNAPLALPLFAGLAALDPLTALRLWQVLSVMFYLATLYLVARTIALPRALLVWALVQPAFSDTLAMGQIYSLLALLAAGAWSLLRRGHPVAAGLLIGALVAAKPNFGVWPLFLILSGQRRAGWTSLIAGAGLGLLPALLYGPLIYQNWLVASKTSVMDGRAAFPTNAAIDGIFARIGALNVGVAASAILVVVLALWVWRKHIQQPIDALSGNSVRPSVQTVSGVALIGALLVGPLAWIGYVLLLLPVIVGIQRSRWWVGALILLSIPLQFAGPLMQPAGLLTLLGSYYSLGLLLLLVALLSQDSHGAIFADDLHEDTAEISTIAAVVSASNVDQIEETRVGCCLEPLVESFGAVMPNDMHNLVEQGMCRCQK